ncbi:MAG: hypothetical protein WC654_00095 [Patescibacteria group bacterium]
MSEPPSVDATNPESFRERLAKVRVPQPDGGRPSPIWELLAEAHHALAAAPGQSDEARFRAVSGAAAASYYLYLIDPANRGRDSIPPEFAHMAMAPDTLLKEAAGVADGINVAWWKARARATLALARHKLARNRWQDDQRPALANEIEQALSDLRAAPPPQEDAPATANRIAAAAENAWACEQAHVLRYQGKGVDAKAAYDKAIPGEWFPENDTYRRAIGYHYLASIPCEWLVLHMLVFRALPQATRHVAADSAKEMLDFMERGLAHCETAGYWILAAHHRKHAAACHAILSMDDRLSEEKQREHGERASDELRRAMETFRLLGLIKPLFISELFQILIDGLARSAEETANHLLSLAKRCGDYYPRVTFDAYVFARILARALDEPSELVEQCHQAIIELRGNALHDLQREELLDNVLAA